MKSLTLAASAAALAVSAGVAGANQLVTSEATTYRFVVGDAVNAAYTPPSGQFQLPAEHADIDIVYDGAWELGWHNDDGEIEAANAYALLPDLSKLARPAGSQWDFLGTNAGGDVYIIPQAEVPGIVFLGIATEESDDSLLVPWSPGGRPAGKWFELKLTSFTGPAGGQFSLWQTDTFGTPSVSIATSDGVTDADAVYINGLTHAHYNFGFTAPGIYDLTFEATTNVVPEPAALSALGLGAIALLRRRRA